MRLKNLVFLIFLPCCLLSQNTFKQQFGTNSDDHAYTVQQTYDHGYIIMATIKVSLNKRQIWLIKTNEAGDFLWSKIYSNWSHIFYTDKSLVQCPDSGFALIGEKNGVYLLRLTKNGDSLWGKELGNGTPYAIDISSHNEFIITGNDSALLFLRTSYYGDIIIRKNIVIVSDLLNGQFGLSITATSDHDCFIGGKLDWNYQIPFIVKTDYSGNKLWAKTFPYFYNSACNSIKTTLDSGLISTMSSANLDAFLLKTNLLGDTIWVKKFDTISRYYFSSVITDKEGYYIACGYTEDSTTNNQLFLLKVSPGGSVLWTRKLFSGKALWGRCVRQTDDRGLIICGSIKDNDSSTFDIILIKTDSAGNVTWIKPINQLNSFSIYPNPASEYITIEIPEQSINATIEIFDLSGKCLIKTKSVPGKKVTTIYIGSLEPGEYLVKISNGNNVYSTKKIIRI